jgi:hypothetical protein
MNDLIGWEENLRKLKAYYKKYRNFNVPSQWSKDKQLSTWVENIRKHPDRLPGNIMRLSKLDFPSRILLLGTASFTG